MISGIEGSIRCSEAALFRFFRVRGSAESGLSMADPGGEVTTGPSTTREDRGWEEAPVEARWGES